MTQDNAADVARLQLKPCPFCGGEARACPDTSYGAAIVFCPDGNDCPVNPQAEAELDVGETLDDAVRRWNTRATTPKPEASDSIAIDRAVAEALKQAAWACDKIAANADLCVSQSPESPCKTSVMGEAVGARACAAAIRSLSNHQETDRG